MTIDKNAQELRIQNAELKMILSHTPFMFVRCTTELCYCYASTSYARLVGCKQEDLPGKAIAEVLGDKAFQKIRPYLEQVLQGKTVHYEAEIPLQNSGPHSLSITYMPEKDDNGRVVGFVGSMVDITERIQVETALRENEARLRLAYQAARIGTFEWNIQADVNVWSPELEQMYGLAVGSFGGTQSAWENLVYLEDRARAVATVQQAFETGEPTEGEWRVLWPDNSVHWLFGRFQVLQDDSGVPQYLTGVNIDITERKRAQEALAESEQRYRGIVETAEEGIATHAPDGTITYVNQRMADMLGYQREQLIGKSSLDFVDDEEKKSVIRARETIKEQGSFNTERKLYRKDGSVFWTLVNVSPRRDGSGNFLGYLSMHTDITERKRAEEALRWQNAIQQSIQAVLNSAMTCGTEEELGRACLAEAEKLSQSKFGFLDEVNAEGGLDVIAISDPGWGASLVPLSQRRPPRSMAIQGIYGRVIHEGKGFFTNEPATHHDSIGIPIGHPPLNAFLGVPMIREGRTIGMIAVGNREGGYTRTQQDALEALMPAVVEAFIRKRAEDALRASEERFRRYFELGLIGMAITSPTKGWIEVNDECCRVLGYERNELLQMTWAELTYPEDLTADVAQFDRVISGQIEGYIMEKRFVRKNGQVVETTISVTALRDAGGAVDYFLVLVQDITERKRAEEELKQRTKELQTILDTTPIAIFMAHDPECRKITGNRAAQEFVALPPDANISKSAPTEERPTHWQEMRNGLPIEPEDLPLQRAARGEVIRKYEMDMVYEDGTVKSVVGNAMPIKDENGKPRGGVAILMDITERKKYEENLRQAKEELELRVQERTEELALRANQLRALAGELTISEQRERKRLALLLHDHLQQLLVGAKFRLTVLGNKVEEDATKQATKEIEELIDESIRSSRSLTAELSPPILHDAGLNAGIEWLGRRMADTQGLFVDFKTEQIGPLPEDLTILLFEAVRELLFNAAKHANTPSASVKVRKIEDFLELTISDQGVGFDSHTLPPAGESGRGFGLFSLRERLELFGGKLDIDSAPGRGSRFVVSVPTAKVQSNPAELDELPREVIPKLIPKLHSEKKIRVLLADDHAVVRQGIANLLSDEDDLEVVGAAADGQEAVNLAAKLLPEVILMDMNMPKLNGVEATRIIHRDFPNIRVIGLSMFEEAEKAQAMRDAGAVNYLTKSGPAEELKSAIRVAAGCSHKSQGNSL